MSKWLVKIKRGTPRILSIRESKQSAEELKDELNATYQTDEYYVEEVDEELVRQFISRSWVGDI